MICVATGSIIAVVKFQHAQASHAKIVAQLQSATTNQVIAALGQPYKQMDVEGFNARVNAMAQEGFPISNADMTPHGGVWLYFDSEVKGTSARRYMTIFFNETNRVAKVETTYWMQAP